MRSFFIICLASITAALPQGYNYQIPNIYQPQASNTQSFIPDFNRIPFGSSKNKLVPPPVDSTVQLVQQPQLQQQQQQQQVFIPQVPISVPVQQQQQQQVFSPQIPLQQQIQPQFIQPQGTLVTKHVYVHVAPDEPEEQIVRETLSLGPARKHYRIIFIKTPSQPSVSSAISLAQAQNEEKTIIYVLSKKSEQADLQGQVIVNPTQPSKPEVYFIKYKSKTADVPVSGGVGNIVDGSTINTSGIGLIDQRSPVLRPIAQSTHLDNITTKVGTSYLPPGK